MYSAGDVARKRYRKRRHAHCTRFRALHLDEPGAAMYYDEESGALNFVAGLLLGTIVGASLALLTAPQSGRKTRKRLIRAVSTARDTASDQWEDLTDEVQDVVRAGRKRIRL
jgi:hypothetical protein